MTTSEILYLALVLGTFGVFGCGLAIASFQQSQADRRAARRGRAGLTTSATTARPWAGESLPH